MVNGGFEDVNTALTDAEGWWENGQVAYTCQRQEIRDCHSAKFTVSGTNPGELCQCVFLPSGDYTLSADIYANAAVNTHASIIVESVDNPNTRFSQVIPLDESNVVGNWLTISLNFTALDYNATGGERFYITIRVECDGQTDASAYVLADNIMLEESIGHSGYSMVEFGNFENYSIDWTYGDALDYQDYWTTTGYVTYENSLLGNVLKIDAGNSNNRIVATQTIFEPYFSYSSKSFIVSGMAKGTQQYASRDFGICLQIAYLDGTTENVYLDFLYSSTDWQFVSKSFTTQDKVIERIDIQLLYNNPGSVCFDNIYVTQVLDDFTTRTEYYANGLVEKRHNGYYQEVYEYDASGNMIQMQNSNNELYLYTYTADNQVEKEQYYLIKAASTPIQTTTMYEYNDFGQVKSVTVYEGEPGTSVIDHTARMVTRYTYVETRGSRIIGALTGAFDSLSNGTSYTYDATNGRLLAEIGAKSSKGVCYTYNSKGQLATVRPATYSASSGLEAVTDAENVSYTYNAANLLQSITTGSTTYTFSYDNFGNTESVDMAAIRSSAMTIPHRMENWKKFIMRTVFLSDMYMMNLKTFPKCGILTAMAR